MENDLPTVDPQLVEEDTDLEGASIGPGLIDCHVHLTGGGGESGPASRVDPVDLELFTAGGTTSVIGVLGTDDLTRSTASLVMAARKLQQEGISAWCLTGGYHLPPTTLTGSVRGDIVHIDRIIGVGEIAVSDHRSSQPTCDELLRVAADAHVAGMLSGKAGITHLHMGDGERGLDLVRQCLERSEIPPRAFHPTHVNRRRALFDEALDLVRNGCAIDVTAFPANDTTEDEVSAADAFDSYQQAGLPPESLTISSDAGGSLPVFDDDGRTTALEVAEPATLVTVLQELLRRGHPLEAVLPPLSSNIADLFRLQGKGKLEVGADADLVVFGEDGSVQSVMARGRWHVRRGELAIRGTFS